MTEQGTETTVQEWTYLGKRRNRKGALCQSWNTPDGASLLLKPLSPDVAIGAVFAITMSTPTQFFVAGPDGPKFVRHGGLDEQQALDAAVKERAAIDEYNRVNLLKRAAKMNSPIESEIERLQRLTYWMTPAEKAAFLSALIRGLS